MERKEFILLLTKKVIVPISVVFVLYHCFKILWDLLQNDDSSKLFLVVACTFATLYMLSYFTRSMILNPINKQVEKTSSKFQKNLQLIKKITNVCFFIALLIVTYYLWKVDFIKALLFTTAWLIKGLIAINDKIISNKHESNV